MKLCSTLGTRIFIPIGRMGDIPIYQQLKMLLGARRDPHNMCSDIDTGVLPMGELHADLGSQDGKDTEAAMHAIS